jgi:hypothetical protein
MIFSRLKNSIPLYHPSGTVNSMFDFGAKAIFLLFLVLLYV